MTQVLTMLVFAFDGLTANAVQNATAEFASLDYVKGDNFEFVLRFGLLLLL
jgi:hypothetical protein